MIRVRHCVLRAWLAVGAATTATSLGAQDTCIPQAMGVPGLEGAPRWRPDPAANFPMQLRRLDDPRWRGALSHVINGQVEFRALYRDSLYLSWHTKVDQQLNAFDQVLLGIKQKLPKPALVLRFTLTATVAGLEAAPRPGQPTDPVGVTGDLWDGTGWQRLGPTSVPPLPSWIDGTMQGTVRGWTFGGNPRWAFQAVIPISTLGLSAGLDLADPVEIWYAFLVGNANSAIPYVWPSNLGFTYINENTFTFPDPGVPWGSLRLGSPPGVQCGGDVALSPLNIGTENPTSSDINLTSPSVLFARPQNIRSPTGAPLPAQSVEARFFLANWGTQIADATFWRPIPLASAPNNDNAIPAGSVAHGTPARNDIHFSFTVPAGDRCLYDPTCTVPGYKHQCMLVQLSSVPTGTNTPPVVFRNQSVYRNMDFVPASTFRRSAEVSVVGLSPLSDGRQTRDVYLYVETFNLPRSTSPGVDDSPIVVSGGDTLIVAGRDTILTLEWGRVRLAEGDSALVPTKDTIVVEGEASGDRTAAVRRAAEAGRLTVDDVDAHAPTYRVHAYHTTGDSVTIDGVKLPILAPQTSFGYWIGHEGELVGWRHGLAGARLVRLAPNFYRIEVPNNGTTVITTTIEALEPRPYALSLHAGVSLPLGTFNNAFDPGFGVTGDFEYWFNPRFAIAALAGYHRFNGAAANSDLDVIHASGALEARLTGGGTSVLVDAGGGIYNFSPGSSDPGAHAGVGVEFEVSPAIALGVTGRVHTVFTTGSNTTFSSLQAGGRIRF